VPSHPQLLPFQIEQKSDGSLSRVPDIQRKRKMNLPTTLDFKYIGA
jgi:hypothetical protein